MKKFTLLLAICAAITVNAYSQGVLLAGWTFPGNSLVADTGLNLILDNEISTMGGTSAIELKNGFSTKAPQVTGWDLGMENKAWLVKVKSTGYNNLTVSSRQQSGGNDPGPKNYKIQFSIDNGNSWSEVIGGEITVENDWTTSYVNKLALPADCNNRDEFWIRWVMALNIASGTGGAVTAEGKSKIDNIFIHGEKVNGLEAHVSASFNIFPNPATQFVEISAKSSITDIFISDIRGNVILQKDLHNQLERIDISGLSKGTYMVSIKTRDSNELMIQKIVIY